MMASITWPPVAIWIVTPPSPSVVGSGKVACWNWVGPMPLPEAMKTAPWAMPPLEAVLAMRLPAFTTPEMVNCATASAGSSARNIATRR